MLEPTETVEFAALLQALKRSLAGIVARVVTWLPSENMPMRRAVLSAADEIQFQSEGLLAAEIEAALPGEIENTFVEELVPPQGLIILGVGDDARPLVAMAALLGWCTTVVDVGHSWRVPNDSLKRNSFWQSRLVNWMRSTSHQKMRWC